MLAFLPVLLTSLTATAYAAPAPAPSGTNGGILGEIVNDIQKAEADIKGLLPNITDIAHSKDPGEALTKIFQTATNDVVKIGTAISSEIVGDLSTLKTLNHEAVQDFVNKVDGFLDVVNNFTASFFDAATQNNLNIAGDINKAGDAIKGIENFIKFAIGQIANLI